MDPDFISVKLIWIPIRGNVGARVVEYFIQCPMRSYIYVCPVRFNKCQFRSVILIFSLCLYKKYYSYTDYRTFGIDTNSVRV